MKLNKLIEKIKKRWREDNFLVFNYRIIFFLLRNFFEFEDLLIFTFLKITNYSKNNYIIKEIQGSKMYLNTKDWGISKDLLLSGVREPTHTKILQSILKSGDTVVDIGANIGYYALMESRVLGPNGKIYAVEPVSDNIKKLKENISLNSYNNIEIFELAIGDEDKKSEIMISEKSNWCSMNTNESNSAYRKFVDRMPVDVMKLDTFLKDKKFPDLVRMDVEGYETEIFKGMADIISSGKPLKILMELHCCLLEDLGFGIISNLVDAGFKIKIFFRDRTYLMLNKSDFSRNIWYYFGKNINGVYEFIYYDMTYEDLLKMKNVLKEEVFHVLFERV